MATQSASLSYSKAIGQLLKPQHTHLSVIAVTNEKINIEAFKKRTPFIPGCLCVQDSPQNPCQCKNRFIIWILNGDFEFSPNGKTDHEGNKLGDLEVKAGAELIIENYIQIKIEELEGDSPTYNPLARDIGLNTAHSRCNNLEGKMNALIYMGQIWPALKQSAWYRRQMSDIQGEMSALGC